MDIAIIVIFCMVLPFLGSGRLHQKDAEAPCGLLVIAWVVLGLLVYCFSGAADLVLEYQKG